MNLNGVEYYYIRNAQGDITSIMDSNGVQVVSYTYDTWGKLISINGTLKDSVGVKNPYRYRGYMYDTETGLYYLQNRYYNPEFCRMLNADDTDVLTTTLGKLTYKNLFSYCDNNPVIRADEGGYFWANILLGGTVGAAISIGSQLISGTSIRDINWRDVGGSALSGMIASIPGLGMSGAAMFGGLGNVVGGYASGSIKSKKDVVISFVSGAVANGVGYSVGKATSKLAKKSFSKLPRYAKKAKLSKIYSGKGSMRNINLQTATHDLEFGSKLCPIKSFIYSTFSSEFSGRTTDHSLRLIFY